MAQKKKFEGPVIGAKMADENRRDFSEATLQAGKNIISLQVSLQCGNERVLERFQFIFPSISINQAG